MPSSTSGSWIHSGQIVEVENFHYATSQLARTTLRAVLVLFPILWPEPFGLAMAEALAYGTPVITYPSMRVHT